MTVPERDDDVAAPCYACRCEEVGPDEIREAIASGALTINDVKRRTRSGMGVCQGIFCVPTMAAMLAEATGQAREAIAPMTARPPARLIPLGALAALEE